MVKPTRLSKLHGGLQASKSGSKQKSDRDQISEQKIFCFGCRHAGILNDVDCTNIAYPVTASIASRWTVSELHGWSNP
jgi:hypothetical protein